MAELIVFLRSREIERVAIMLAQTTIGRDESADVTIDNLGVSRIHASVVLEDGHFHVRDAESENGITLNGTKVQSAQLKDGDVIGINKYKIHFSEQGGVPIDMLMPATRQVGDGGRNVVATMTVDAEAAKRIQEHFIRQKRGAEEEKKPQPGMSRLNQLLALTVLLSLAAVAYVLSSSGRLPF